jgi:hypothetical protein
VQEHDAQWLITDSLTEHSAGAEGPEHAIYLSEALRYVTVIR